MKKLLLSLLLITSAIWSFAQQQFDYQAHSTTGSDTYTVSITNVTAYSAGTPERGIGFSIIFDTSSSGACTLNVNSLGAITINGDITADVVYRLEYNVVTDEFDMISGGGSSSSTTHNKLPIEYHVNDFEIVPGDTSRLLVLQENVDVVTLGDFSTGVDGSQFVIYNNRTSSSTIDPDGQVYFGSLEIPDSSFAYIHFSSDTFRISSGGASSGGGDVSSVFGRTGAVVAVSGDYEADEVTNTPAGTIAATEVQAAIDELDIEKVPTSRTISTTSPLSGGGDLSANRTLTIANSAADGSTKGAASFTAADFDASSGNIAIDYTNGPDTKYWKLTGSSTVTTPTITGKPTWTQAAESSTNTFQTFTQAVHTGGSPVGLLFTAGAHTTLTASTEATDINFNLARTVQFSSGTITTQRAFRIQAPTYASTGGATTITNASTLDVTGPPIMGTSMTLTNTWAASFGGQIRTTGSGTSSGTYGLRVFNNNFTNSMFSVRDDSYAMVGRVDFPAGLFRTSDGLTPAQTAVNMTFAANASGTSGIPFLGFYSGTDAQSSGSNTRIALGTLSTMMTFQSTTGGTPTFYYYKASPTVNVTTSTSPYYTFHASPVYTAAATSAGGFTYDPTTPSNIAGTEVAFNNTSGQVVFNSDISPAQLAANTDDYAPTGHLRALTLRLSTDASRNLTSVAGGADGRMLIIFNIGAQNLVIKDDDGATGTAANRFQLNADITILPEQGRFFMYDGTSSRWRAISNQ